MNVDETKGVPKYSRIVPVGILSFLPAPKGTKRDFMYVFCVSKSFHLAEVQNVLCL